MKRPAVEPAPTRFDTPRTRGPGGVSSIDESIDRVAQEALARARSREELEKINKTKLKPE